MALDRPFGEAAASSAFYLGGGYKYAMAGEGCAFLHAPPGFGAAAAGHRLVRRVRGSEPAAGQRRLCQGCAPLPRRDFRSVRRSTASTRCSGCSPRTASPPRASRRMSSAAAPAARRARRDRRWPTPSCSTRSTARPHARFLAFRSPHAQRWYAALKAQNCITDVRGDVLRIGFGIYQDEGDVDRLVQLLGGTCSDGRHANRPARRVARPRAAARSPTSSIILDRQILGILAGPIIGRAAPHRHASSVLLSGPPFAILYSVLGIPFAFLADRTSRSRVIAAAVAFWSAFTGAVRHGRLVLAIVHLPHGRRHWRSGRRRAVLCADRRLFRAAPPRPGAGHLLARGSDRPRRSGPCSAPISPRRSAGARPSSPWASPAAACAGHALRRCATRSGRARADAVADRPACSRCWHASRCSGCWPLRPRRARCAATVSRCGLRRCSSEASASTPDRARPVHGLGRVHRRLHRRVRRRLARRPARRRRPGLVCEASGDRLADHRADLRCWA